MPRADERGWAQRGSQLQMQIYVNRVEPKLSTAVLNAFPDLARNGARLRWRSPLERERFAEYRDTAFVNAIERSDLAEALADLLAERRAGLGRTRCLRRSGSRTGSRPGRGQELSGGVLLGRDTRDKPCVARTDQERHRSDSAVAEDRARRRRLDEADSARSPYLVALSVGNRHAALYWLREVCGVDARLVHVLFENDRSFKGATHAEWEAALAEIESDLGLNDIHLPQAAHVFLPALTRDEFVPRS